MKNKFIEKMRKLGINKRLRVGCVYYYRTREESLENFGGKKFRVTDVYRDPEHTHLIFSEIKMVQQQTRSFNFLVKNTLPMLV